MILTDGSRLVSDESVDELHDFALRKVQLPPRWFHDVSVPYYELLGTSLQEVLRLGAVSVSRRELKRRAVRAAGETAH